jgi:1-acyl-sn-glycerol-3-phosphate acyltransferase
MKKIQGILFLVYFWLFCFFYGLFLLIRALLMPNNRQRLTEDTIKSVNSHLFATKITELDQQAKERIEALDCGLILVNHQSFADYSVCTACTDSNRVGYVGRAGIYWLMPTMAFATQYIMKRGVLFRRNSKDRHKMRQQIYNGLAKAMQRKQLVVVFPEGHRHLGKGTLPLKSGIINWAYEKQVACAIVLYYGNDKLINEKDLIINRGQKITCWHREIYHPRDYSTAEEFFATISRDFAAGYAELVARVEQAPTYETEDHHD